ncbi:hypothetical protein AB0392_11355 [Nonomuraea angiospora]|uniref:hypothetical protein n=1 Tax=Nonomuraea angiospora TaxID=46172 RepID=UPI0034510006
MAHHPADSSTVMHRALPNRHLAAAREQISGRLLGCSPGHEAHGPVRGVAEDSVDTSTLLAYSGHTSIASLARYARVSPEALARWRQARDPATRRRKTRRVIPTNRRLNHST